MQRFKVITLIDITETKQYRKEQGRELERQQQQNFVMLLQVIGLRVNPLYRQGPVTTTVDLKNQQFGSAYRGKHSIWTFTFETEYDGGLAVGDQQEALLISDLHFVPVVDNLNETIQLVQVTFDTRDPILCNTLVYPD